MFRTALLSMFLTSTALADTWTVDDDGKADFDNIQAAVDAASDGDEIIVMPGTYTSTADEVVNMLGKAVTLRSLSPDNPDVVATTIIDGGWVRRGILCDSGETIKTIIDGFTIHNSYATGYEFYDDGNFWYVGAGTLIKDSSPGLTNCTFTNNTAEHGGGGVFAGAYYGTCDSSFINCTFTGNTAGIGGGMYNEAGSIILTYCTFTNNTAEHAGGGVFDDQGQQGGNTGNATLTGCTFTNNTAEDGGGMYNDANSKPTLIDSGFRENTANVGGGGLYNNNSNPTLTDCGFIENTALKGGGMDNEGGIVTLTDCTISHNSATNGGGLYNYDNSRQRWPQNLGQWVKVG